jgi:hypothetical protein
MVVLMPEGGGVGWRADLAHWGTRDSGANTKSMGMKDERKNKKKWMWLTN